MSTGNRGKRRRGKQQQPEDQSALPPPLSTGSKDWDSEKKVAAKEGPCRGTSDSAKPATKQQQRKRNEMWGQWGVERDEQSHCLAGWEWGACGGKDAVKNAGMANAWGMRGDPVMKGVVR